MRCHVSSPMPPIAAVSWLPACGTVFLEAATATRRRRRIAAGSSAACYTKQAARARGHGGGATGVTRRRRTGSWWRVVGAFMWWYGVNEHRSSTCTSTLQLDRSELGTSDVHAVRVKTKKGKTTAQEELVGRDSDGGSRRPAPRKRRARSDGPGPGITTQSTAAGRARSAR